MMITRPGHYHAWLARAVVLTGVCGSFTAPTALADVTLPSIISDHMVLQCDTRATIWGWANPGDQITVAPSWSGPIMRAATADANGSWSTVIDTPTAGGPHTVVVKGPDNSITISDVLVGEVWVCGGQSNMEWSINAIGPHGLGYDGTAEILAEAKRPQLRYFDVPNVLSATPAEVCGGKWVVCSPQTAGPFSAVGYFFGSAIQDRLEVPVGLIGSNWGGTRVEAWTSASVLSALGVCGEELEVLRRIESDPDLPERLAREREAKWWDRLRAIDPGSSASPAWSSDRFDDSGWDAANLPGPWEATSVGAFDGVMWYRRTFDVPAGFGVADATLHLGPIDDMDTVWVNGKQVGGLDRAGVWFHPRNYDVPAGTLRDGANTIAIRVLDTGGAGGLTAPDEDVKLVIHKGGVAATDMGRSVSLAGAWKMKRGVAMQQLGSWPWSAELHANSPSVLYNGMIVPIRRYAVRGAIWYQGESNRGNAWDYRRLFPAMIADWRRAWNADPAEFPFYFVQIAPFTYGGDKGETAVVRESQHLTMQSVPNTGMVVTMDVGNPADIHPRNKKTVGDRLALWALAKTYGAEIGEYSGPIYESMQVIGDEIEIAFTHADELRSRNGLLIGFEIAGSDWKYWPAAARITGNSVIVSSDMVREPVAVRYGWDDDLEPNLFNGAGLPAAPFRTDEWPVATRP